MSIKWKVGDECYFDFEKCEVGKVDEDGRVTLILGDWMGRDLRHSMQPVNERTDRISKEFNDAQETLHKLPGLNYPDIHCYLVEFWMTACDEPELEKINIKIIKKFVKDIQKRCSPDIKVNGIQVFRW